MTDYQMIEISNQQAFLDAPHMTLTPRIELKADRTYTSLTDLKANLIASMSGDKICFTATGELLSVGHHQYPRAASPTASSTSSLKTRFQSLPAQQERSLPQRRFSSSCQSCRDPPRPSLNPVPTPSASQSRKESSRSILTLRRVSNPSQKEPSTWCRALKQFLLPSPLPQESPQPSRSRQRQQTSKPESPKKSA
jgi:hypothetical protein